MKKLTSVILIGAGIILFTACSPKVAESTTGSNTGAGTTSSSSSTTSPHTQTFPGESRHARDPNLPKADKYLKKDPNPKELILTK